MAKSSSHIDKGFKGFLAHNSRESYSHSQVFFDEKNELWNNKDEAFEIYRAELKVRGAKYEERIKQSLQKNALTHLSMIVNLEQHHSLDDLKPLNNFIENRLDTKIFQVGIHRDEGKLVSKEDEDIMLVSGEDFFANLDDKQLYYDKGYTKPVNMYEWVFEKNYHAHVEFMGLDSEGMAIKRNRLTRTFLQELQDLTAETLNMERGQKYRSYSKEQMQQIKAELKPKKEYVSERAYAQAFNVVAKEMGYYFEKKSKRVDTHPYKKQAKVKNDAVKKAKESWKEVTKKLRAELQAEKAIRPQYAWLEQRKKELEQLVKLKELAYLDAIKLLKTEHSDIMQSLIQENQKLKDENEQLRTDQRSNYERTLEQIDRATDDLSRTTEADIIRVTEAYQAKRGAEEVNRSIEHSTHHINGVFGKLQRDIQKVTLEKKIAQLEAEVTIKTTATKEKNAQIVSYATTIEQKDQKIAKMESAAQSSALEMEALKNQVPVIKEVEIVKELPAKISFDDVKNFHIKYQDENMTIDDMIKHKNKRINQLQEQNASKDTALDQKDAQIADLEKELEEDNEWIYTDEVREVLDISETYVDEVQVTWKDKAEELKETVEKLEKTISTLNRVVSGMKKILNKVFDAFNIKIGEDAKLEEIEKELDSKLSLFNPPNDDIKIPSTLNKSNNPNFP